jgi:hypothetical protein
MLGDVRHVLVFGAVILVEVLPTGCTHLREFGDRRVRLQGFELRALLLREELESGERLLRRVRVGVFVPWARGGRRQRRVKPWRSMVARPGCMARSGMSPDEAVSRSI